MRKRLPVFCLLAALAPAAFAQSPHAPSAVQLPPGLVPLDQGWRSQAGDNIAWAQPDFDDSAWQPVALSPSAPLAGGTHWFRLKLNLAQNDQPVALLIEAPSNSFAIWFNGRQVPGFSAESWLRMTDYRQVAVPLPLHGGEVSVAVRFSIPQDVANTYTIRMSTHIGGVSAARAEAKAARHRQVLAFLPWALVNCALIVAGLGALLLYFAQRSRREYLWLGLYLIVLGSSTGLWQAADGGLTPLWSNSLVGDPTSYLILVCQIEFSFAFINRKVSRIWRACECLLFVEIVLAYFTSAGLFPTSAYWSMEAIASAAVAFGIPILLLMQYRRGNREAGLLILPSLLPAATVTISDMGSAAASFGLSRIAALQPTDFALAAIVNAADVGFLLAIGALLLFRLTRLTREQARAAAELEAAQRVQSLLLRRSAPEASPAQIQVVYRPAQEVGGDFFHTVQIGALTRIVVGDVSGKGVGAALLVSVLLGALDAISDASPAAILSHLNAIMLTRQRGGFATCVCAALASDGRLTLANAGHLAPYRNGDEVPIENGLPLGIAPDAAYTETTLRLAASDQLTFLSDGVVEAQTTTGELFGFERTRSISTQSAEAIAQAAQQFGQEDDITVLTLTFAPAEVLHA